MFYKTDYNSPVGNITLGADGEHIVGLWIKGQKYFADTVKEKMFQNDDLPVFQKAKNWLSGIWKTAIGRGLSEVVTTIGLLNTRRMILSIIAVYGHP